MAGAAGAYIGAVGRWGARLLTGWFEVGAVFACAAPGIVSGSTSAGTTAGCRYLRLRRPRTALRLRRTSPVSWPPDRKSTRLNSSHLGISYAVFCLKKKKN